MAKKRQNDSSRVVLVALVVGVVLVSLVGTWLVLQTGFSTAQQTTNLGFVSFTKSSAGAGATGQAAQKTTTSESSTVSFIKTN